MLVVQVNWLRRDGRRAAHIHGRTRPYRHGGGETPKLELDSAFFMARWVGQREHLVVKMWMC